MHPRPSNRTDVEPEVPFVHQGWGTRLGMKVKTCINPQRWGARMDLDFPRIYVWIVTISREVNVTIRLVNNLSTVLVKL